MFFFLLFFLVVLGIHFVIVKSSRHDYLVDVTLVNQTKRGK